MTVIINGTTGITSPEVVLDNSAADGGQVVLKSSGYSNWNWDNYSGRLRAYYNVTEYFTIDTSGNVGIGTSSPGRPLTIGKDASSSTQSAVEITTSTGTNAQAMSFGGSGSGRAYIGRANSAGGTPEGPTIGAYDTFIGNSAANNMVFYTNTAERARIDTSGNLLVGTTSNPTGYGNAKLMINAGTSDSVNILGGSAANCINLVKPSGFTNGSMISFNNSSSTVGSITISASATAYNTSSDYRLKENIAPMTGALATVAQLKPVTYKWKLDGSDGQGFIAHELQEVVPDCVTGEKDAVDEDGNPQYQGIDTSFLVATLTAAIQEQQQLINAQQAALTILTARIEALEAK